MPATSVATKAEATAEPGLVTLSSGLANESVPLARPGPSPADTTTLPQPIACQQDGTFIVPQSQSTLMGPGAFPIHFVNPSGSIVVSRPLSPVTQSVSCSHCGLSGHSKDTCRKRKRYVGCRSCGIMGHLEHQCKTSGSHCRYCFKNGHSEANCDLMQFELKRDMIHCTYCSNFGHDQDTCYRKRNKMAFRKQRASTIQAASHSLREAPASNQSSMLRTMSKKASENPVSRSRNTMGDTASNNKIETSWSHGRRAPVARAGNAEIAVRNSSVQMNVEDKSASLQCQQPTSRALSVNKTLAPIDKAETDVLAEKETNSNSPQQSTSLDMAECVVHKSTSKPEESTFESRRGLSASATTRHRKNPANSSPTVYVFQDTFHNSRAQRADTTDDPELFEFQRKLMKERREEAIRLRRVQKHVHC